MSENVDLQPVVLSEQVMAHLLESVASAPPRSQELLDDVKAILGRRATPRDVRAAS